MARKLPEVTAFMRSDFPTLFPWDTIKKSYDTLMDHNIRALPVLDGDEKLVGIISERDIVRYRTRNILPKHAEFYVTVSDLMTQEVNVFSPETSLREACERFVETNNNQFPVVEDEEVIGIVTQSDLLRYFSENLDDLMKA